MPCAANLRRSAPGAVAALALLTALVAGLGGCERNNEAPGTDEDRAMQGMAGDQRGEETEAMQGMAGEEGNGTSGDGDSAAAGGQTAEGPAPPLGAPLLQAVARLSPTEGNSAEGEVTFTMRAGLMQVDADLRNLPPGPHGLHIHEIGDCSAPDASSAGGHFTPEEDPHGAPSDPEDEHHAGDLGNVVAGEDGTAQRSMSDPELTFQGPFGIVGRAVVLHQGRDDLASQPSGAAGPRIACGVIGEAEPMPGRPTGESE